MLYYLGANKSIQDRLRKEINDNIGENGRIDLDVLNDMEYMDQVFHGSITGSFIKDGPQNWDETFEKYNCTFLQRGNLMRKSERIF